MGIFGFELNSPNLLKNESCDMFGDYLFKIMMLKEVGKLNEAIMTKVFKCREKIDSKLYALSQFPKEASEEEALEYIKSRVTNKSLIFKVNSFYRLHKRIAKEEKEITIIMKELLSKSQSLERGDVQLMMLNRVKKLDNKLWKDLLTLYISSYSSNILWTEKIIERVMRSGPYYALFYNFNKTLTSEQVVVNFLIQMSTRLSNTLKQEKVKYFISRIADYGGKRNLFKQYESRFAAQWSLNELRDLYSNMWLRFHYFDFFIDKMMSRASEVEMRSHMRKALCERCIKEASIKQLWFVKYFFPKEDSKRKLITKKMKRAWRSGDPVERYIVIDILKVPQIKKYIEKDWDEMQRGYFKIARDYYRELLSSGRAKEFALYNLYKLGDYDEDHLWWLAF